MSKISYLNEIIPVWLNINESRMKKKLFSITITMIYHPNTLMYWCTFSVQVHL